MKHPTEETFLKQEKPAGQAAATAGSRYLRLVEGGVASSASGAEVRSPSGDAAASQVRRTWACLLSHIGPDPRRVVLLGVDRSRNHISGYRITRPRQARVTVPYPHVQPTEAEVEAAKVASISTPSALAVGVAGATGVKRGQVTHYSDEARKRLKAAVLTVGHELLPRKRGERQGKPQFFVPASFVTLTYHAPNVPHIDVCYRHLRAWWKRVKRRFPDAWGLFVREYQASGALHFHALLHWGVNRWTTAWADMQSWISNTWAEIVAVDLGEDEQHRQAGTNVRPVLTQQMLAEYVAKGGVQKLQPGVGLAVELSKRVQKGIQAQLGEADALADDVARAERYAALLEEARGHHWWGYLDRKRAKAHAREVIADVGSDVVRALKGENDRNWMQYLESRGVEVDPLRIPQRASGRISDRIIEAAGVRHRLMTATWIDAKTGECLGEPVEVSAVQAVVVGGEDLGQGQVVAWPRAGSAAVRAVPALWAPVGVLRLPPLLAEVPKSGPGPPGPKPPRLSAKGYPLCVRCGVEQFRLGGGGLCVRCDGSLPVR